MKKYLFNSFFASLLVFTACLVSCSSDSGSKKDDPLADKAELIVGNWSIAANGVVPPTDASSLDWSNFSLSILGDATGGPITASGVPDCAEPIWPASSAWGFSDTEGNMMIRGDDVQITIDAATESSLTISFPITHEFPVPDPTKGFFEAFNYPDETIVRDDIEYDGIFVEWPVAGCDLVSGGDVSIEDGVLIWEWTNECEAAIGWEFESPMDLTGNSEIKFKYQFEPTEMDFSVYFWTDGGEGQLYAPDDFQLLLGADGLNEATVDLSKDSASPDGYNDAKTDLSTFGGFYLICGWELAPGTILKFDDITVGEVSLCSSKSISGDWTFTLDK